MDNCTLLSIGGEGESNDSCKDKISRPNTNDLSISHPSKGKKSTTPHDLTIIAAPNLNKSINDLNNGEVKTQNNGDEDVSSNPDRQLTSPNTQAQIINNSDQNPDGLNPTNNDQIEENKNKNANDNINSSDNLNEDQKLLNEQNQKNAGANNPDNGRQLDDQSVSNLNADDPNSKNQAEKDIDKQQSADPENNMQGDGLQNHTDGGDSFQHSNDGHNSDGSNQDDDLNSKSGNNDTQYNPNGNEVDADGEDNSDSQDKGDDSENQDNMPDDDGILYPKKKKYNPNSHHDYSEIDFSGDEVFELPSNSESFKAGTIFRAGNTCFHDKVKEADLGQIIFRARLMVKQRELSIKNRKPNPENIQRKLVNDEEYYPLNPEHSRRRLQLIAKKACKKKMRAQLVNSLNEGINNSHE